MLTSCLSLRACLRAKAINTDKYQFLLQPSEGSLSHLAVQSKDAPQAISLSKFRQSYTVDKEFNNDYEDITVDGGMTGVILTSGLDINLDF